MEDVVEIRPLRQRELADVAELRWRWVRENGATPPTTREVFVSRFVRWARENEQSHRCVVAVRGGTVVGMAWLATVRRVPSPLSVERASGDVQCVYVVPDERDGGLGGRLVEAVLDLARELGHERVTVHSSDRAVAGYRRWGFDVSPRLLQADPAQR
ncbi:GNAT family N-acetyltransferase [Streptomyces alkaliterrae]|uniref:GNAT family N-acetyltransferase n=1 Tax=Streptomyces alkaliterrae TaxID=2213162 RepID=A0A5P0YTV0_9ACTN|nr:GNAT family N-acetyltransferase [Streptomyces alkaliterrae]MBB1254008.1 GNAT family N-acetyltransferase [Streptomyces alkaliterrae]MBB1259242.1 GNAT family N-acetyltransferase [Streptomyces alkaliterrae]MQS03725.1 GNAT family N-acetyltransferase [Streptomyces alkaliterrae]